MNFKIFILGILILTSCNLLNAQEKKEGKIIDRWEANLSEIYFYGPKEKESSWGTEVHISYEFIDRWFIGSSVTFKYALKDKKVNELAIIGGYEPLAWLCLNFGVDFSFIKEMEKKSTETALYAEAEFNVLPYKNKVNLGPVAGALVGKNSELYTGLHLEFKF